MLQPPASAVPVRHGLLRVVSNRGLDEMAQAAMPQPEPEPEIPALVSHIRERMQEMRNFRNTEGIAQKLIDGLRAYRGQYDAAKLQEIRKTAGSEVYARITATKCRAATALLRDVYLGPDRPWDIDPTPVPEVPQNIEQTIQQLVSIEVSTLQQTGMPIDQQQIADRVQMLRKAAERAAKKQAEEEVDRAAEKVDDLLWEGNFYEAFAEFLIDLPIFPYAVIKGPVVRMAPQITWQNGQCVIVEKPRLNWYRVSPFDLYWSPGAANVMEAEFIERIRLTRKDLRSVRELPGYNKAAIDAVLDQFSNSGFRDWWDATDSERAALEERERWPHTSGGLIDTAEYHGSVSGKTLLDWGMDPAKVPDPLDEYRVQAWLIDRHVIKVQIAPSPRQRANYYISSFEKVPGSIAGSALPELLDDVQSVGNATMRALVNNLSIASGPQVVINDEVLAPGETDDMFPWKRWHVRYDPMIASSSAKPIEFFQPNSYADVLLGVYEKLNIMADEVSALPRYMTGNERVGGAGRTASGLAMLMGNASKTLQNVAASIDRDVIEPMLQELYDMIMMTMPGVFRGDEKIIVKGVNHAQKREQDRMRQLEFLQITANPMDMNLIGPMGRANVLRSIAGELGLDSDVIVPDDDTLKQMMGGLPLAPGAPGGVPMGQVPGPENARNGPEQVRQESGAEQQFANNGRAGSGSGANK